MKKWKPLQILKIRVDLDKERSLDLTFTYEDSDPNILTLKCTEDFIHDMRVHLGNRGIKTELIEP